MLLIVESDKHQVFQNQSPCWPVQLSGSDYFQASSNVGTGSCKRQQPDVDAGAVMATSACRSDKRDKPFKTT